MNEMKIVFIQINNMLLISILCINDLVTFITKAGKKTH